MELGHSPIGQNWPDHFQMKPNRLLFMTLARGSGEAPEIIYGPLSQVVRDIDALRPEEVLQLVQKGMDPAHAQPIGQGPDVGRSRTTLSLAAQGAFILALTIDERLAKTVSFADPPFSTSEAYAKSNFGWMHRLSATSAVIAAFQPLGSEDITPFNVQLIVDGGDGSGDDGQGNDYYAGVRCRTPIIVDPDVRWPDGTNPPGLPPPP